MGIRTVFNLLGPLSNPAGARHGVIGVYSAAAVGLVAGAAAQLGAEHLYVVHGHDGLDEITITGLTTVAEVRGGAVRTFEVAPEDFGVSAAPMEALRGGDAGENAAIVHAILAGETGPRRDIVLMNAAAALVAGGAAANFTDGARLAAESIDTGRAESRLRALVAETRELV
jgi:anthranilate phosphoribosyltransferase